MNADERADCLSAEPRELHRVAVGSARMLNINFVVPVVPEYYDKIIEGLLLFHP